MERKFDVMAELGTDLILLCSNCSSLALDDPGRILDDFAELGARAARRNIRVGYEALAWGRHIHDHRDAWSIVRDVNRPNIGLVIDNFHSLSRKVPVQASAILIRPNSSSCRSCITAIGASKFSMTGFVPVSLRGSRVTVITRFC